MLKKAMPLFEKRINQANRIAAYIGVGVIMAMVLITSADVIMRRLFHAPIIGAHEIQQLSLLVVTFMTWGYCQVLGGHIDIGFLTDRLPRRITVYIDVIFNIAAILMYIILTWRMAAQALHMKKVGLTTAELRMPEWPFLGIFSLVGIGLFVLALVTTLAKNLTELKKK